MAYGACRNGPSRDLSVLGLPASPSFAIQCRLRWTERPERNALCPIGRLLLDKPVLDGYILPCVEPLARPPRDPARERPDPHGSRARRAHRGGRGRHRARGWL